MKISKAGKSALIFLIRHGPIHAGERDQCLNALGSKGLVKFHSGIGEKYASSLWHLTPEGRTLAGTLS